MNSIITGLDRPEYKNIPLFTIGNDEDRKTPIFTYRYNSASDALSPLHRHRVMQINYISRGKLIHQVNNARYELVRGDIFVIPPFVPHQMISIPGVEYEYTELEFLPEYVLGSSIENFPSEGDDRSIFDFSYIEPFLVTECNVRPRMNLSGTTQLRVEELLDEIYEEFHTREDSWLLAMKADLLKLLVIVGRAFHAEIKDSPEMQLFNRHCDAITHAIRYIDENFDRPITLEEVSRYALLSQSYFSYMFKTLTGKTYLEYVHELRIKKAMDLLAHSQNKIADICFLSGFNSINHFDRIFKSMVGLSPSQYRSAARKAGEASGKK